MNFTDTSARRAHIHIQFPGVMALACVSGTSIVFDMSLTYILVALLAVILNNVLVERLSMHTRITVGKSDKNPLTDGALIVKQFSLWELLLLLIY